MAHKKLRPAAARILRDLQVEDEDINTYAAMSVLRLKDVTEDEIEAILPVLRTATSSRSISVRFFSRKALNEIKLQMSRYPRFQEELDRLRDETKRSSWHDLLSNLEAEPTEAKLVVLNFMRDLDDLLLPPALQEFIRREREPFVLAEAIKVLGLLGAKESVDFLEEYLSHGDSRIRSNAVEAMAQVGGVEVMRSILPLLEDDDNRVKATVAKICSQHGEHQVVRTLALMLHSVEIWMRESATYSLGYVPCGESIDLLLEACCDVNPEIQRKAIEALGKLGARRAQSFLSTIVGSAEPAVAAAANHALANIRKELKDYPYFDPDHPIVKPHAESARTTKTRKLRLPEDDLAATAPKPGRKAESAAGPSLTQRALNLISSPHAEDEGVLEALVEQRGVLVAELGKLVMDLYRAGKFDRPYLKLLNNEVKKLRYLIEQKESQKKDLKEEAVKSTFMSFIKESVSRFTHEKQVDSRMDSLNAKLREVHLQAGEGALKDPTTKDLDVFDVQDLPTKIGKLDRQIEAMQRNLIVDQG